jgi:hypothetical protein
MSPQTSSAKKKYLGKYRGVVFNNADPEFRGRIQALVPDVLGMVPTTFALPCLPLTGMLAPAQCGAFFLPPLDANVWIEFEHGDVDYPIWSGCFWGSQSQIPIVALAGTPETAPIVLQSAGQNTLWIGGDPVTGITISCGPAMSPGSPQIKISQAGILITDGKGGSILIAAGAVTINEGALLVK